jgi:hypothetical protein
MSASSISIVSQIEQTLGGERINLIRKGPVHWERVRLNDARDRLDIRLADDWLLFAEMAERDTGRDADEPLWPALQRNSTELTPIRIASNPNKKLSRCAELLLGGDDALEPRVIRILEAFEKAREGLPHQSTEPPANWAKELERLCGESGWPCVLRASGRLTIGLSTTPPLQVTVTPLGPGLRLSTEAFDLGSFTPLSRSAAALLALQTSGPIPLVRATTDESRSYLGFEVVFPVPPAPRELDAACGGLSVVAAEAGEALSALRCEDLARDYLAVRGWTAQQQKPETERKRK